MFNRILVPLDGSKLGELALPYVEELAGSFSSEVALIFVCETAHCQHRHEHQAYVEKVAEQGRNHIEGEGLKATVKSVVLNGHPAAEIVDYAEKDDVNLIVMVSHGRSGIMPWAMGSVAARVIQRASKPVLFIRAGAPSPKVGKGGMFSKIIVPLDGSEAGEAALPYIKELTSKLESEVTLLQIVAPGQHVHTVGGLDYVLFPEIEVEHLKAEAKQYLEKTSQKLADTKAIVKCEVRTGDAAQEIIKFADETNARLVAISTHGRSGIRGWFAGSVAYKVLHAGNTSILLARAPGVKS